MKKLIILCMVVAALVTGGCQTAHIKTPEWEATLNSHWFTREVDSLSVTKRGDGGYNIRLNGYKGDTSEQLPVFTREMFSGLVALGQLIPAASKGGGSQGAQPIADGRSASGLSCPDGNCTASPCPGGNCTPTVEAQ